ncbi:MULTISPECIES: CopG family transcriptional regulator [unclassified Moraxella]|uniref:CopG family transcriptional regulator n=1 Tax=unclassified Moraxella TaxID=2685852 RepID=UPI003AF7B29D
MIISKTGIGIKTRKANPNMIPLHIKITEEMHDLLGEVAQKHGFPRIQGLIRLYIRQGLDREDVGYSLANDSRFLAKLKRQGVSDDIINMALHHDDMDNEQN